jgi:hypothetical protein
MRVIPSPAPTPESLASSHATLLREAELPDILGGAPTLCALCALTLLLIPARRVWPRLAAVTATALVGLPLGMLLMPLLHLSDAAWAGGCLALGTLLLALPAARLSPPNALRYYVIVLGILFLTLLVGALTGAHLWQNAWIASWITADPTRTGGLQLLALFFWIWAWLALRHSAQNAATESFRGKRGAG